MRIYYISFSGRQQTHYTVLVVLVYYQMGSHPS